MWNWTHSVQFHFILMALMGIQTFALCLYPDLSQLIHLLTQRYILSAVSVIRNVTLFCAVQKVESLDGGDHDVCCILIPIRKLRTSWCFTRQALVMGIKALFSESGHLTQLTDTSRLYPFETFFSIHTKIAILSLVIILLWLTVADIISWNLILPSN